jgi:glycosyltransferase involved in cell wall biosynthesis
MFSVIVPSVGRPDLLRSCLGDLILQDLEGSFEIIVVNRRGDQPTRAVADEFAMQGLVRVAEVLEPGFVRALREGVAVADGDYVAFCDDDARYPHDWLSLIKKEFRPGIGGVGGFIREGGVWAGGVDARHVSRVGLMGRTTYDVRSEPRFAGCVDADILPGANMAYIRHLLSLDTFDPFLDGAGSSPGNELAISWSVRKQGYRTVLCAGLVVDHYSAPWVDGDRGRSESRSLTYSRNMAYVCAKNMPWPGLVLFVVYFLVLGQRESPGLLFPVHGSSGTPGIRQLVRAKAEGLTHGLQRRTLAS